MLRPLLLATALLASSLPAAAKETVVTISWAGVQRSELSISRMRVVLFPRVRRAVCDSYRRGTMPGQVLKSGGTVRVVFRGAGGDILTSFSITRDKCA
jgi:hypothetical protein